MVRPEGFEPPTLCLEGRCSIRLSYGRAVEVNLILKHLLPFQKLNPPLSAVTVSELCQNPHWRAHSGTVCPSFRWLGG
jgi:hypothetical protein